MRPTRILLTTAAVCGCLVPLGQADAASRFTIRGAGFGHGVGMSQYGAYGYALQGATYRQILAHYYTGTALGAQAATTVRVLLQPSVAVARFTGGRSAGGGGLQPPQNPRRRAAGAPRGGGARAARRRGPARPAR